VFGLTKRIDLKRELDDIHERVFPKFLAILKQYLDSPGLQKIAPPPAGIAEAITVIGMYESSKKIECYSQWLAGLTVILIVLTVTLIWRTFLP
jgi:hypothetical protein